MTEIVLRNAPNADMAAIIEAEFPALEGKVHPGGGLLERSGTQVGIILQGGGTPSTIPGVFETAMSIEVKGEDPEAVSTANAIFDFLKGTHGATQHTGAEYNFRRVRPAEGDITDRGYIETVGLVYGFSIDVQYSNK